ncbi:MAG: hypothetical protein ACO1OB_27810 [Archangium sp.]
MGLPLQSLHDGSRWLHEPLWRSRGVDRECASSTGLASGVAARRRGLRVGASCAIERKEKASSGRT